MRIQACKYARTDTVERSMNLRYRWFARTSVAASVDAAGTVVATREEEEEEGWQSLLGRSTAQWRPSLTFRETYGCVYN